MTKNKRLERLLFKGSYLFLFLFAFFGHIPTLAEPLKFFSAFSLVLIAFSFIYQAKNNTKSFLIKTIPLLLISSIFVFTSNSFIPLKLILLVVASSNIDFKDRIKFDFSIRAVSTIIMLLLFQIGLATDVISYFDDGSGTIKHSLGFSNANVLGLDIFLLCVEIIYLSKKKKLFINIIISMALMLAFYNYSASRSSFISLIIFIIIAVIYRYKEKILKNKIVKYIAIFSPTIIGAIIATVYLYTVNHVEIGQQLDLYTSGRITNIRLYANNFPINAFGSDITITEKTCDVAVVYILYSFGVTGMVLYLFGFTKLIHHLYKQNDTLLAMVFITFLVYGMSEKLWLYADYNIFMTAFSYVLYNNTKETKKKISSDII